MTAIGVGEEGESSKGGAEEVDGARDRIDAPFMALGSGALGRNALLGSLDREAHALLAPHLSLTSLPRGTVLFEPGEEVQRMLFPCEGTLVSLAVPLPDGHRVEAALVGREGAVGGLVSRGCKPAYARCIAQVGGEAWTIGIERLHEAQSRSPALTDLLVRYADCLLAQLLQSIACNVRHTLEKRMARWLLQIRDSRDDDELPLTHDYLGQVLGVGRTYVTRAAGELQQRGLIAYRRGIIRILDPVGLRDASCGCQCSIRAHYDRILQPRPAVH